ncbi:U4/U6-U5 snRNP complex subunit prp31 [Savitreella phatthalungensis]
MSDLDELLAELDDENDDAADFEETVEQGSQISARQPDTFAQGNALLDTLEQQTRTIVAEIRTMYVRRLPELANLARGITEYVKAIKIIGQASNDAIAALPLADVLAPETAMAVAVSAVSTTGAPLTPVDMLKVQALCDQVLELEAKRQEISQQLASSVASTAPNLAALIGSRIACNLISASGGIEALARSPSCNVASLGKKRVIEQQSRARACRAEDAAIMGDIWSSDLVQRCGPRIQRQAVRQVSAKVVLAARLDSANDAGDGSRGLAMRDELSRKLDKLAEAPSMHNVKALPAPDDPAKKRRGGRKVRKAKERFAITDMQRLRNRLAFGQQEEEIDLGDETEGLGMLGSAPGRSIRAPPIDSRTRAKLPKEKRKGGSLTGYSALMHEPQEHAVAELQGRRLVLDSEGLQLPVKRQKLEESSRWI